MQRIVVMSGRERRGENPGVGRIPGKYGCFLEREVEAHVGVFSSKTTCQLVFSIVGSACVCLRVCVWSTRRFCTHQMLFLYFKTFYLLNIESQTGKSHQTTLTDVAVVLCTPAIKTQTEFLQLKNISWDTFHSSKQTNTRGGCMRTHPDLLFCFHCELER